MALFKILKGDSSRISTDVTPFHNGYAYFTSDDGGFYIDSEDDGIQRRIRINPEYGSAVIASTLLASGWSSGKQMLNIDGMSSESNGVIGVAQNVTETEMEAAKNAGLYVCAQDTGTLTVAALGEIPTCNIPVVVILID